MSTILDRQGMNKSTLQRHDASPASGAVWLQIDEGSGAVRRLELGGDSAIVGRVAPAEVLLEDPTVSRRHAEFFRDPFGRWWVRDLGSRNGTLVNGAAAREQRLSHGDHIAVGSFTLTFLSAGHRRAVSASSAAGALTLVDSPIDALYSTKPSSGRATGAGASAAPKDAAEARAASDGIRSLHDIPPPHIDARHVQTLSDFSQRLLSTADPHQRLEQICRLMLGLPLLGRWAAALRIAQPISSRGINEATVLDPPPEVLWEASADAGAARPYVSRGMLRAVIARREAVLAGNQWGAADVQFSISADTAAISAIACPLTLSDEYAASHATNAAANIARNATADSGPMDILYAVFPAHLQGGDWLALVSLACRQYRQADSVWAARQHAETHAVIEHDLERARDIQLRLLPRNPNVPGMNISIGFQPSRWVGGDYVDVIVMPGGRALLTVADVAGKGIAAALIAFGLHTTVHAGIAAGMDLSALGKSLNDYVRRTLEEDGYVTMFAAFIDPTAGELTSFNAGHPRPCIIEKSGSVRRIGTQQNLPLGVDEMDVSVERSTLDAGELLVLFTDGLTELFDAAGNMLDDEGLGQILSDLWAKRPAGVADLPTLASQMQHRLQAWQGRSGAEDDRTFLLATRA